LVTAKLGTHIPILWDMGFNQTHIPTLNSRHLDRSSAQFYRAPRSGETLYFAPSQPPHPSLHPSQSR